MRCQAPPSCSRATWRTHPELPHPCQPHICWAPALGTSRDRTSARPQPWAPAVRPHLLGRLDKHGVHLAGVDGDGGQVVDVGGRKLDVCGDRWAGRVQGMKCAVSRQAQVMQRASTAWRARDCRDWVSAGLFPTTRPGRTVVQLAVHLARVVLAQHGIAQRVLRRWRGRHAWPLGPRSQSRASSPEQPRTLGGPPGHRRHTGKQPLPSRRAPACRRRPACSPYACTTHASIPAASPPLNQPSPPACHGRRPANPSARTPARHPRGPASCPPTSMS